MTCQGLNNHNTISHHEIIHYNTYHRQRSSPNFIWNLSRIYKTHDNSIFHEKLNISQIKSDHQSN